MTHVVIKWSKWISLIFAALMVVILLALGGLLFTNTGLNLALWGAEKFVPQLTVSSTQGALFPRFTLHGVVFKDDDLHVDTKITSLTLAVTPTCLTEPRVCIDELAIKGLNFSMPQLPPSTPDTETAPETATTNITSPVPIKVSWLKLEDINLDVLGNQISWRLFTSSASFQGNRLRINTTKFLDPLVKLAPSSDEESKSPQEPQASPSILRG